MDNRQLIGDDFEQQQSFFNAKQADIQTAMPGIILSYDHVKMTCSVQPAIQGVLFKNNGADSVNLPVLVDCPIVFPRGTDCVMTWPITLGQECLVIFSSRCIDSWWQLGGMQSGKITPRPQLEMRLHDLSDGFVIPGPFSQTNLIPNIAIDAVQIRNTIGDTVISLNPITKVIDINTPTTININAQTLNVTAKVNIKGNVDVDGKITSTGDMVANGISVDNHVHSDPQGGNTGAPH